MRLPSIALLICLVAPAVNAAEKVPLASVVTPYMGDDLELAVIPWSRDAKLSDQMLVAARLEIEPSAQFTFPAVVKDAVRWADSLLPGADKGEKKKAVKVLLGTMGDGGPADRLMQALRLPPEKRTEIGEQGYLLFAGELPETKEPVIAILGIGPAGTYYGVQTLRQLTLAKDGKIFVRMAQIIDWPAMPWRGSKRPLSWEELFKANFGPLRGEDNKEHFRVFFGAGADPQRNLKSWEIGTKAKTSASRGLDASDAYIDWLAKEWQAHFQKTGNPLFMLKGDDIELDLDEKSGTRKRFGNNYGAAFVHLLTELNKRLKALDPRCTLYWMPNPYYTVNWDFELLSRQVRDAGGLPSDVGLYWTGHYVFSGPMTAADISGYQKAFYGNNPIKVRGFIYDNHGRATENGRMSDYFAMPERDPEISKFLAGISNERGSWINRITSYDFQWNPKDYKADRSLKLAVRELTNRDPAYYKLMLEFIHTWEAGRYPSPKETTHAAAADQQKAAVAKLNELRPKIQAVGKKALDAAAINFDPRDGDYRKQFLDQVLQSIGQKEALLASLEFMWRDANAPAYVIPAAEAPKIDGKLDDACYQRKPTFDRFVTKGGKMVEGGKTTLWEVKAGVVPEELSTQGWFFADDKNLYLGFRCNDKSYPRPGGQKLNEPAKREKVGNDHPYCWRQWCLDINLDVKNDGVNSFHMIFDPLGQVFDEYLGWPGDPLPTGPPWTLGDNFKVVRDGNAWTVEAAIPLETLGVKQIKSGDVWGTNLYRNGMNVVSMFSMLQDTGPYGVRYPKVFGKVHWK